MALTHHKYEKYIFIDNLCTPSVDPLSLMITEC